MGTLRQARDLIADEQRWCRFAMGVDADGVPQVGSLRTASAWCASGALLLMDVSYEDSKLLNRCVRELFPASKIAAGSIGSLVWVNDNLGHEAVMQAFDKAIVEVEGGL